MPGSTAARMSEGAPVLSGAELAARLRQLQDEIDHCRQCALAGHDVQGMPMRSGDPEMARRHGRVMLVGQAPGRAEADTGLPFSGPAGQRLFRWLAEIGISEAAFRRQVYLAAMTRCYPGPSRSGRGDRRASTVELALCRAYLDRQLSLVNPQLVIVVGQMAIEALLGQMKLDAAVGRLHERDGRRYLPLPHPSGASAWLNDPAHQALVRRSLRLLADSALLDPDA